MRHENLRQSLFVRDPYIKVHLYPSVIRRRPFKGAMMQLLVAEEWLIPNVPLLDGRAFYVGMLDGLQLMVGSLGLLGKALIS